MKIPNFKSQITNKFQITMTKLLFGVWCLVIGSSAVFAQQPAASPHEAMKEVSGSIIGRVLADKKDPLPNHFVTLEVFKDNELILSLPKSSDSEGKYKFKNIFRTADFSYVLSSEYNGKTYRTKAVSLGEKENELKLDLYVGAGADEATADAAKKEDTHVHKRSLNEYQLLAILLSVVVIIYAFYRRRKRR